MTPENQEPIIFQEILSYKTTFEDRKWLEDCYSGCLKSEFSWDEHGEELLEESSGILSLRQLGSNLILIQSASERSTEDVLFEFDEWSSYLFEWIRSWKDIDVNSNRRVWTRWYNIPIHAWFEKFFAYICSQIGRFVSCHLNTEKRINLDVARTLVSTSSVNLINKTLKVGIYGVTFTIRVMEEL